MKILTSGWTLALLASLLNIGTTAHLIYSQRDAIFAPVAATEVEKKSVAPRFWSFRPDDVDALIAELNVERKKMTARETELDKAAAQIEAEKSELEKTRAEIVAMREEMSQSIPEVQTAELKNLKTLAQTYSAMTPGAVVAIFREMDEMMSVKILALMKPEKVAAVLQEMSRTQDKDDTMAKRAARISDKLRLLKPAKKEEVQS